MIYFARDPQSGLIKIGHSYTPQRRVHILGYQFPGVALEAYADGGLQTEGALHALFVADHAFGEWFNPSPRLEAMIIAVREGWARPADFPYVVNPLRRRTALQMWARRRARLAEAA